MKTFRDVMAGRNGSSGGVGSWRSFTMDKALGPSTSQEEVFRQVNGRLEMACVADVGLRNFSSSATLSIFKRNELLHPQHFPPGPRLLLPFISFMGIGGAVGLICGRRHECLYFCLRTDWFREDSHNDWRCKGGRDGGCELPYYEQVV